MKAYREQLIEFLQRELPALRRDLVSATNALSLHAWCTRAFPLLQLACYELVALGSQAPRSSSPQENALPPSAPLPAPPVLAPQTPATSTPTGLPDLPDLPPLDDSSSPSSPSVQISGMPPVDVVPGVQNIVVTPTGPVEVKPDGSTSPVPPTA